MNSDLNNPILMPKLFEISCMCILHIFEGLLLLLYIENRMD